MPPLMMMLDGRSPTLKRPIMPNLAIPCHYPTIASPHHHVDQALGCFLILVWGMHNLMWQALLPGSPANISCSLLGPSIALFAKRLATLICFYFANVLPRWSASPDAPRWCDFVEYSTGAALSAARSSSSTRSEPLGGLRMRPAREWCTLLTPPWHCLARRRETEFEASAKMEIGPMSIVELWQYLQACHRSRERNVWQIVRRRE